MKLEEKYLTDANGNRIGVFIEIAEYQKLLAALEELEAIRAYDDAMNTDDEDIPLEQAVSEIESSRQ